MLSSSVRLLVTMFGLVSLLAIIATGRGVVCDAFVVPSSGGGAGAVVPGRPYNAYGGQAAKTYFGKRPPTSLLNQVTKTDDESNDNSEEGGDNFEEDGGEPFDADTMTSIEFATLVEQVKLKLRDEWQVTQMQHLSETNQTVELDKWANSTDYRNQEYERYQVVALQTYDNIVRRVKEKRRLTPAELHEMGWLKCYDSLLDLKIENGQLNNVVVDGGGGGDGSGSLGQWVEHQRILRRLGQLPRHHQTLLKDIGFQDWRYFQNIYEEEWYKMYEELKFYYEELAAANAEPNNPFQMLPIQSNKVVAWEVQQRELYAGQLLPPQQQALLSGIHGFNWNGEVDKEKHNYQDLPPNTGGDNTF